MTSFVLRINPQLMNSEGPKLLFLLAPVFVFCCCNLRAVAARDTITAGNPLTGNQSVISENGDFELTFFQPGDYYGYPSPSIYCRKCDPEISVWSIYIDGTVPTTDLRLNISDDGNLILLSNDGSLIWSTNVTSPPVASNSTVAVLLDSGNLVLRDGLNSSKSNVLWQSFDHPTDTWLPGAPLGFDRSTGNHIFLNSFAIDYNYYFSVDEETVGSPQFVVQNKEPGEYDLFVQHFAVPTMIDIHQDSQKGTFTFHAIDGYTIIILATLRIHRYIFLENSSKGCVFQEYPFSSPGVDSYCGPFGICDATNLQCICPQGFLPTNPQSWGGGDYSSGCRRAIPLSCQNTSSGYSSYYLEKLPDNPQSFFAYDLEQCQTACTSNCSCTAYSFRFGCILWFGDLLNSAQCDDCSDSSIIRIRAEIDSRRRNKHPERSLTGLIIGAVLGTATVLAIGLIVAWRCKKRSRAIEPIYSKSFRVFSYSDLKSATKNFSKKLGQGSFGSVFMGTLRDSTLVAVKKLQGLRQGEKQFRAEVITVGMIQHINIVRLLGFCAEGTRRLLVYEYMPNGSLDSHLFSKTSDILDWNLRY